MTTTAILLAGVDRHRDRYRVRKTFPAPFGRVIELHDTADEANGAALELERRRRAGLPPRDDAGDPTLAAAAAGLLKAKRVSGRRRKLTARGESYWARSLEPWLTGEHAGTPLSMLRRADLEDALLERAAVAPTSARNERQALFAALERAEERGATFDPRILRIPPVVVEPRDRRALAAAELDYFAARTPPIGRRLVLLQGTVGNRIDELFAAEPVHVDLDAATLFVPAANCKERVDKTLPLTGEEVLLVREQLGGLHVVDAASATAGCPASPPGASRLFLTAGVRVYDTGTVLATKGGPRPWRHSQYDRLVWQPAVAQAAADWRLEHGLEPRAATPFEWWVDPATAPADGRRRDDDGRRWITTHDLRATAVTLMRDAGVSREDAAARVGHADRGELVDAVYDKGDRAARAGRAIAKAAPEGLRAVALGGAS